MWHKELMPISKPEKLVVVYELHQGKDKTIVVGGSLEVTAADAILMIQAGTAKAADAQIGVIPEYLIGEGVDK